jgi:ABC-type transport system involved in multi-copper enzyme maturation permease subunit
MLSYKSWCESRARFAIAAVLIAAAAAGFVLGESMFRSRMVAVGGPVLTYVRYVDLRVFTGLTRALYLVLAIVLGLGGLARESTHGTLGFTLALPVRHSRHVTARTVVGLAELVVLAAIPVVVVPLGSLVVGESYAWSTAIVYAGEWVALGAAVFATGVVLSLVIRNEYAALAIALVGLRLVPRFVSLHTISALVVAIVALSIATVLAARERAPT